MAKDKRMAGQGEYPEHPKILPTCLCLSATRKQVLIQTRGSEKKVRMKWNDLMDTNEDVGIS